MKVKALLAVIVIFFGVLVQLAFAEEYYIITASDGSEIVVKDYTFTDEFVEYTTKSGLPGFIRKEDFLSISNMIGVQSGEAATYESVEEEKRREIIIWVATGFTLLFLYAVFMLFVTKRKKKKEGEVDIYYGRAEKEPVTQGHLSFEYRGFLGRKQQRTVEVTSAYEEEGILYINGYCTVMDERKTFRADRVVGKATDLSRDHKAPIEDFFVDSEE